MPDPILLPAAGAIVYNYMPPTAPRLRGLEAPEANSPAIVEREYMSFDAVEGLSPLRGYKVWKSVWPLGTIASGSSTPVMISCGGADTSDDPFEYAPAVAFDGGLFTEQLDFDAHGRFLAVRVEYAGNASFTLSGFDADIELTGRR